MAFSTAGPRLFPRKNVSVLLSVATAATLLVALAAGDDGINNSTSPFESTLSSATSSTSCANYTNVCFVNAVRAYFLFFSKGKSASIDEKKHTFVFCVF